MRNVGYSDVSHPAPAGEASTRSLPRLDPQRAQNAVECQKLMAAVPEAVMNDLIIRGSMDAIRAHVQRYLDAGVDTAFLALSTLEQDPAVRAMLERAMAVTPEEIVALHGGLKEVGDG